jgi:hypothetical protein
MLPKGKKNNTLSFLDGRGFKISVSVEQFNKIYVSVDTDVEDYIVDAHFAALDRYRSWLLSILSKRSKIEVLTRTTLSINRVKWNLAKIYWKIERMAKRFLEILGFNKLRSQGGEPGNE